MTIAPPRLTLSHTQLEAAVDQKTGCWRRWWFFWGLGDARLPKIRRTTQTFGEVGHGVVERWLRADDLGVGPAMYPKGWALTLNNAEQDLIRRLVDEAILQGVLKRTPGRLVEHEFNIDIPCKISADDVNPALHFDVTVTGRIDCAVIAGGIGEVTDHKFLKQRKYFPSREALAKSGQHLLYVNAMADFLRSRGEVVPDQWDLAVNAFSKDPADFIVKRIVARATLADARKWWDDTIPAAIKEAIQWRDSGKAATDWRDVRGPADTAKACNAYGGCAARAICANAETVPAFVKRVTRLNEHGGEASSKIDEKRIDIFQQAKGTMGKLFDERIKNRMADIPASSPPAFTPGPTTPDAPAPEAPPWAKADCRACEGTGISSRGEPCTPCVGQTYKDGRMDDLPHNFDIKANGDGRVTWTRRGAQAAQASVAASVAIPHAPPPDTKPRVVEQVAEHGPNLRVVKEEASWATPEVVEDTRFDLRPNEIDEAEEPPEPHRGPGRPRKGDTRGPGRPRKGLTLYLDCAPIKGRGQPRDILEVLTQYGDLVAKDLFHKDRYFECDPWARRDAIRNNIDVIAAQLGSATIAAFGLNEMPDERVFFNALKPYASDIITAVGGLVATTKEG